MRLFIVMCTFFYLVIAVMPCQASIITYDSEAAFLAAAGSVDFESFETLPPSDTGTDFLTTVSTSDFDVSTTQDFLQVWGDPPVSFAPHGDQVLFWYAESQGTITFDNFGGGIFNFGLYINDWADIVAPAGITAELIFFNDIGDAYTIASTSLDLGEYNDIFFGVVSDTPFYSASFVTTNDDGWVFFDKVYTDTAPIPEPATLIIFGLGLLGTGCIFRKKILK